MNDHDPDAIIRSVLGPLVDRCEPARRPRMVLALDPGLEVLERPLIEARFRVVVPGALEDRASREAALGHRNLVTRDTGRFLRDATALDFGIIGLDAFETIDTSPTWDDNVTARAILDAFWKFNVAYRPGSWVLMVHPSGEHVFVRLA